MRNINLDQSKNERTRLLVCQGPLQLVNILSCLFYEAAVNQKTVFKDYLLLSGAVVVSEKNAYFINAILDIAKIWPWAKIINLIDCEKEIINLYKHNRQKAFTALYEEIGVNHFDQVYSARNWQQANDMILNAYKDSYHVCYGDGLGWIDYIFSEKFIQYDEVRQIMPVYRNNFPEIVEKYNISIKRTIIDRQFVIQVADSYLQINKKLGNILRLSGINPNKSLLLITSTWHESGFMTLENEILSYIDITKKYYDNDELIIIKPHPREQPGKAEYVANRISEVFCCPVIILSDNDILALPIEIIFRAFKFRKVVGDCSSGLMNLRLLYNVKSKIGLDEQNLKYFNNDKQQYIWASACYCRELMGKLKNWNGKDVLVNDDISYVYRPDVNANRKGESKWQQQDFVQAIKFFIKAVELNPFYRDAYNNLGVAHHHFGDIKNALVYFEKAYELNKADAGVLENLAKVYITDGRIDDAKKLLLGYLQDFGADRRVLNLYLNIFVSSDSEVMSLACELEIDVDDVMGFLEGIEEKPLYLNCKEGKFVRAVMLCEAGKYIRGMFPKFKPWCVEFPSSHIVVLSDGTVTTCCGDAFGKNVFSSVYDNNLEKIWRQDLKRVLYGDLYDLEKCRNCIGSKKASFVSSSEDYNSWISLADQNIDSVTIEIMGTCNYGCCVASDVKKYRSVKPDLDLIFENIKGFLGHVRRLRLFNYGEPLLHNGFVDFVGKCRQANPEIVMLLATNGMLMDEKIAKGLIEHKLNHIVVSVHGGPGTENMLKYSKYGADYGRVLENIRGLLTLRDSYGAEYPKVSLRAILFEWNDTDEIMDWFRRDARGLGLKAMWGNPETDNYHWILDSHRGSKRYRPGCEELKKLIESGEYHMPKRYEEWLELERIYQCKLTGTGVV